MTRGLGKGLDSLIPEFYDENFDSNGAQSLEDMLKDDKSTLEETKDEIVDETKSNEEVVESSEEIIDEGNKNDEKDKEDKKDIEASEELHSDTSTEKSVSDTQDIKTKENVAEVLDIVDKNPRITLWSSRSAAVFRYLRKTEPEFSISREASILIDEAVSKKYPDIWELFDDL